MQPATDHSQGSLGLAAPTVPPGFQPLQAVASTSSASAPAGGFSKICSYVSVRGMEQAVGRGFHTAVSELDGTFIQQDHRTQAAKDARQPTPLTASSLPLAATHFQESLQGVLGHDQPYVTPAHESEDEAYGNDTDVSVHSASSREASPPPVLAHSVLRAAPLVPAPPPAHGSGT